MVNNLAVSRDAISSRLVTVFKGATRDLLVTRVTSTRVSSKAVRK